MISSVSVPYALAGERTGRTGPDSDKLRRSYEVQRAFSDLAHLKTRQTSKDLDGALESFQKLAALHLRHLSFTVREEADLVQVVVTESNGEDRIIRKIPPDEIVRMIERRNEILGFLFDRVV